MTGNLCQRSRSSESELRRHFHEPTTEFVGSKPKAGGGRVGCIADTGAVQRQDRLLCISRTEAVEPVVEKVERGDAEAQISFTSQAETLLRSQVRVEERWTLCVGEDVSPVGPYVRKTKAGSVDILVRAETRPRIAL